jgi:hypothetical protein
MPRLASSLVLFEKSVHPPSLRLSPATAPLPRLPLGPFDPVARALARLERWSASLNWCDLRIAGGTTAVLPGDALLPAPGVSWVTLGSMEEVKRVLGHGDEEIRRGERQATAAWPRLAPAELEAALRSGQGLQDLELALRATCFGDSAEAAAYRQVLDTWFRPMQVALVAARQITIEAGAVLRLAGRPTVLVAERLDLCGGGRLEVRALSRIAVGTLCKHPAPSPERC